MKKLSLFLGFTILFLGLTCKIYSQTWPLSRHIECDNDLRVLDIKADQNKDIYITGVFKGNLYDSTARGNFDIFLMKLNQDYQTIWYKTFGSTLRDHNPSIVIDQANNVFLTGSFQDSCIFENTYLKSTGLNDVFLLKYSPDGTFNWVKNIAKFPSRQLPAGIEVDKNNDLLIIGSFIDSVEVNSTQYYSSGSNQFILKTDTSSSPIIWFDLYPSSNLNTKLSSVSAFDDGYYFNGYVYDTLVLNEDTIVSAYLGKSDLFLYRTDYDGNNPWVRRTYGNGNDVTGAITQDNYGNIYYTGYFNSTILMADSLKDVVSNVALTNKGSSDIFIFKYSNLGKLIWSKGYGLIGDDYGIDINQNGDILFVGGYFSDSIIFNEDTLMTSGLTDSDLLLATFDLNGNVYNADKIGNTDGLDLAQALFVTDDSRAIIAGNFASSSLVVGDSTYINGGLYNGIVAKYFAPISTAFTKIINPTCNAQNDGELIVTPKFGEAPYTYLWSHDPLLNDSIATGLSAGTYKVKVTGAMGTSDSTQYALTEPKAFIFNPVITPVTTCSNSLEGEINLNVTGGNTGKTYFWAESEGGSGVVLTDEDQINLAIGRYDVTVTDSKSCTDDTTIYITGPAPISFAGSTVKDYTNGADMGEINLSYTGDQGNPLNYIFSWTGPSAYTSSDEDIVSLEPGNYDISMTDENGCSHDSTFTVKKINALFAYISSKKNDCNGGDGDGWAVVLAETPNPFAVLTYEWSNGQNNDTIIGLTANNYVVTVTDTVNSDIYITSVDITDLGYTFAGSLAGTDSVDCKGDTDGYIDLTITGAGTLPYTYSWSNLATTQDITNLGANTYSVTVTDDNECSFSIENYLIEEPALTLTAIAGIEKEPSCNGDYNGEIRVDASGGNTGGYNYQWDDPGSQTTQIAFGLDAGIYEVTVTDRKGCTASDTVNLTQPDVLSISETVNNLNCFNVNTGSIDVTVLGGSVSTGYDYNWSSLDGSGYVVDSEDQSGLGAGTYKLTVTDDNLCVITDNYTLTEPTEIKILDTANVDISTCNGDNNGVIVITATGGIGVLTYTLNPGATQVNNTGIFAGLTGGTYTVNVTDENNCGPVITEPIKIFEPTAIAISESLISDVTCNGGEDGVINITVSGGTVATGYGYNWVTYNGSGLIATNEDQTGLGAGTYNLTVTDDNSCTANASVTINQPSLIVISETAVSDITCNGLTDGSIDISVSGGAVSNIYAYNWSTTNGSGHVAASEDQTGLGAGNYNLTVTDDNLCEATTSITINEPVAITIDAENSTDASGETVADGTVTITASGGTGNLIYTLNPGNISNQTGIFTSILPDDYTVEVTDDNSCGPVITNTITVGFIDAIDDIIRDENIKIYPNPTSDKLYIEINYESDLNLEVLSISGQVLFNKEIKSQEGIKEELDLSIYPKGIYFIRIYNNQINSKSKILLQ